MCAICGDEHTYDWDMKKIKESAQEVQRCEDEEKWGKRPSHDIEDIYVAIRGMSIDDVANDWALTQAVITYLDKMWERNKK